MGGTIQLPASPGALMATSKPLSDLLRVIARPVSGVRDPTEVGAVDAFHMALDWLLTHKWNWYHMAAADFASIVGTAAYTIPTRCRTVYNVRATGADARPLFPVEKALYDKLVFDQSPTGTPSHYHLAYMASAAELRLLPTPQAVETFSLDIYRDPVRPTDLTRAPDIAEWMERPLVLHAQGLVTRWRGGQGALADSLLQWAERAKQDAMIRDSEGAATEEPGLVPYEVHGVVNWPWNAVPPDTDFSED